MVIYSHNLSIFQLQIGFFFIIGDLYANHKYENSNFGSTNFPLISEKLDILVRGSSLRREVGNWPSNLQVSTLSDYEHKDVGSRG